MSLLLEALKKAALEKQSKTDPESVNAAVHPQSVEPNSNGTLKPTVEIQPVAGDALPDDPLLDALEDLPDLDLGEAAETFDVQAVTVEAPDLDHHTLIPEELEATDEEPEGLVFEPEFGDTVEPAEAADESETEPYDELMTQAELEAAKKRLDEEQTQEEQRRIEEKERRHRVEKEQYLAQQERRRQEELEQQRKEKAEYDERKRQAIKDREALDKLISSGKDIERKAKRR
jgi:hypothetical protein